MKPEQAAVVCANVVKDILNVFDNHVKSNKLNEIQALTVRHTVLQTLISASYLAIGIPKEIFLERLSEAYDDAMAVVERKK